MSVAKVRFPAEDKDKAIAAGYTQFVIGHTKPNGTVIPDHWRMPRRSYRRGDIVEPNPSQQGSVSPKKKRKKAWNAGLTKAEYAAERAKRAAAKEKKVRTASTPGPKPGKKIPRPTRVGYKHRKKSVFELNGIGITILSHDEVTVTASSRGVITIKRV